MRVPLGSSVRECGGSITRIVLVLLGLLLGAPAFATTFSAFDCVPVIPESSPIQAVVNTTPSFTVTAVEGSAGGEVCEGIDYGISILSDTTAGSSLIGPGNNVIFFGSLPGTHMVQMPSTPGGQVTLQISCITGCESNPAANRVTQISLQPIALYDLVLVSTTPAQINVGQNSNVTVMARMSGAPFAGAVINWALDPACSNTSTGLSFAPATSPPTSGSGQATTTFGTTLASAAENYCVQASWTAPDASVQKAVGNVNAVDVYNISPTTAVNSQITVAPTSVSLGAMLQKNGSPVANGTLIEFQVFSFAPRTAGTPANYQFVGGTPNLPFNTTTSGGIANASFNSSVEGVYQIEARFSVPAPSPNARRVAKGPPSFIIQAFNVTVQRNRTISISSSHVGAGQAGQLEPIEVRVQDDGVDSSDTVLWSVVSGNGSLASSSSNSVSGLAGNTFTYGNTPGSVTVRAERASDSAVFVNFSLENFSYQLNVVGGNTRAGQAGSDIGFQVRLDRVGATVSGASGKTINWTQSGPGTGTFRLQGGGVNSTTSTTDGAGIAAIDFNTPTDGSYTVGGGFTPPPPAPPLSGSTPAPLSVSFATTVSAAPIIKTLRKPSNGSGDGQGGEVNTTLPAPLVVIAENNSSPVAGVGILWTVSGGAILSSSSTTTDGVGQSSINVTLPATAGTSIITASRADQPSATTSFIATATGQGITITKLSGDGQRGLPGRAGDTLQVRVDRNGVPLPNAQVTWQLLSGNATLGAAGSTTDGNGMTQLDFSFGASPGPVQIAALFGSASAVFNVSSGAPQLSVVSGDQQSGDVQSPLAQDFVVQIAPSPTGKVALDGIAVDWQVLSGGGSVSPAQSLTDASGRARARLTLGPNPGLNQVRASVGTASAVFNAAAQTAALETLSGDLQRGLVGTLADQNLVVRLKDQNGNPIPNTQIRWSIVSGSAALEAGATSSTDAQGQASNQLRFGATAGPIVVMADATIAPLGTRFTAIGENPALTTVTGNNQSGTPGQPLAQDLIVKVGQPNGKSLAGVTVQWQVLMGGGSLASVSTLTNAAGEASNQWTLGSTPGQQRVVATLPGGQQVPFLAQAEVTTGVLSIVSGNAQTLPTNSDSQPLVVQVKSAAGAPLAGVEIRWRGDNAALSSDRSTTNASGQTSITARVQLPGVASVTAGIGDSQQGTVTFGLTGGTANVPGLDESARRVGAAIDTLCPVLAALPNRTTEQNDLLQRCSELVVNAGTNPDAVRTALNQLPTEVGTPLSNSGNESIGTQIDNLDLRLHMIRGEQFGGPRNQFNLALWTPDGPLPLSFLPSALLTSAADEDSSDQIGGDFSRWGFFATGQIGRGEVDAGQRSPKFDFDISGLTAGVDYRFSDKWIGGIALGYAKNDAELAGSGGTLDTRGWSVSAYATWYNEKAWYVDGTLLYGRNDYDMVRRLNYSISSLAGGTTLIEQRASASTDGNQLGASLSLGRDWQKGPWSLNGYLKGSYSRVETDAYAERMLATLPGQGLALAIDARETKSMTSIVGGRATYVLSRDWGILMPSASVEWEHEFKDDPGRLTARFLFDPTRTPIEQIGDEIDTDYFNVGIGLSALFPGGKSAFLYYEQVLGAERLRQGLLSVGVRIEF